MNNRQTMTVARWTLSLFFILTLGLTGCTGNQPFGAGKAKQEGEVVLGANGLPNRADLLKAGPLGEKTLGSDSAPVTMIEYMSLTCPFCRAFHQKTYPRLKSEFIKTGKVRYIVREFPIGRSAGNAALITRCGTKDRTHKLIDLFLGNQPKWVSQEVRVEAIYSVAKSSGLPRAEFDKCLENQDLIKGLQWVKDHGRKMGVSGTPTFFFIKGETVEKYRKPLTIEELRQIITPLSS